MCCAKLDDILNEKVLRLRYKLSEFKRLSDTPEGENLLLAWSNAEGQLMAYEYALDAMRGLEQQESLKTDFPHKP